MLHAVFYWTEDNVLKGRIGGEGGTFAGATGSFPPRYIDRVDADGMHKTLNEVASMRDGLVWAAGYGAVTFEVLTRDELTVLED